MPFRTIFGGKILSYVGPWSEQMGNGRYTTGHGATAIVLNQVENKIHYLTFMEGGAIEYHAGLFVGFFDEHVINETEQILHYAAAAL